MEPRDPDALIDLLMRPTIGRLLTLNRQLDLEMRKQLDRQKPQS